MVRTVRPHDVGDCASLRLWHFAEVRGTVSQLDHCAVAASIRGRRAACLSALTRCRHNSGIDCRVETELALGLRLNGRCHARDFRAEFCARANSRTGLLADALLVAAFTLGRFPQPKCDSAGPDAFSGVYGLYRPVDKSR